MLTLKKSIFFCSLPFLTSVLWFNLLSFMISICLVFPVVVSSLNNFVLYYLYTSATSAGSVIVSTLFVSLFLQAFCISLSSFLLFFVNCFLWTVLYFLSSFQLDMIHDCFAFLYSSTSCVIYGKTIACKFIWSIVASGVGNRWLAFTRLLF